MNNPVKNILCVKNKGEKYMKGVFLNFTWPVLTKF